jgi:hypothetical protein
MSIRLTPTDGGYLLSFPFDRVLVNAIKALPYADRRWDGGRKAWIIAPNAVNTAVSLVQQHTGIVLQVPALAAAGPVLRAVKMEYLGRSKPRDGGSFASGYMDGSWSLLFPEPVLRSWFGDLTPEEAPTTARTLYQVLMVKQDTPIDEIKAAYRRLARTWHPDVCKEPDAAEQFQRIQHAWETLRDDKQRRKYNAGLALEASQHHLKNHERRRHDTDVYGYRAPLRNGYLFLEGSFRVGQLAVSKILSWNDITDQFGRTMVSSWPAGAETFSIDWV